MTDAIVEFCKAHKLLLDRETYIAIVNPATGEAIKIKASKKVAFRVAKDLKMAV